MAHTVASLEIFEYEHEYEYDIGVCLSLTVSWGSSFVTPFPFPFPFPKEQEKNDADDERTAVYQVCDSRYMHSSQTCPRSPSSHGVENVS